MDENLPIYKLDLSVSKNKMEEAADKRVLDSIERIEKIFIPSTDYLIPAELFVPTGADDGLIIYFHGGDFTLNSIHTHEFLMRKLANKTKHKVLGVDFRLAPENKFPIPLNDCIASIIWSYNNENIINYNHNKLFVGGDSSGGTLALSSALYLRKSNLNYISKLFIMYPLLDDYNPGTKSYIEKGYCYPVSREFLIWGWNNYLKEKENRSNEFIFPLKSKSFKGLPKLLIMFGKEDALSDENYELIDRLKKEKIAFESHCYEKEMHGFMMNDSKDAFHDALNRIDTFLK